MTFHIEAAREARALSLGIREAGARVGVAVKPATDIERVVELIDVIDMILVMTVEPGFGGQSFMTDMMPKLRTLADECRRRGSAVWLQVDGGISESTIEQAAAAGAIEAGQQLHRAARIKRVRRWIENEQHREDRHHAHDRTEPRQDFLRAARWHGEFGRRGVHHSII